MRTAPRALGVLTLATLLLATSWGISRANTPTNQVNLTEPIKGVGEFDVIFLRNVMIYFDNETKRKVVENMLPNLKPGGHFIVGHSESLNGITDRLKSLRPTIYQKPF